MLDTILALIGFAVKHEPDVERFFAGLATGEPSAVARLVSTLPKQSASGIAARKWAAEKAARERAEQDALDAAADTEPPPEGA